MPRSEFGSLTKEPPLETLDRTITAITPGMRYAELLLFARRFAHRDAPGLVRKRFLLVDPAGTIDYDRFLSLVREEGVTSARVRKVMYFVWAFRDERFRRFICEVVANSAGKWRIPELLNKSNSLFFRRWFPSPSTTPAKARSNLQFFLVETGIFDQAADAIRLELDDGWLTEAMQVAAQHEPNRAQRNAMVSAPTEFLVANGLNGLANATKQELQALGAHFTTDYEPLEDTEIHVDPAPTSASRPWAPRNIPAGSVELTHAVIDQVARERANRSHLALEQLLATAARAKLYQPQCNQNIDLHFVTSDGSVLAEVKSCHDWNLHSQVRRGISQLFEYRYAYRSELGGQVDLLLVVESTPKAIELVAC